MQCKKLIEIFNINKLSNKIYFVINPLNTELNLICHLLALLGAHHILHVSGARVKSGDTVLFTLHC
jgi:hypothetical protein